MLNIFRSGRFAGGRTAPTVTQGADLAVAGISKSFGEFRALSECSLAVDHGRTLALLGPSGCGKTTLLRVIAGLEVPDEGSVVLGGDVLTADGTLIPPERRHIGMVFQDGALFPHMTVAENVGYGVDLAERDDRVSAALAMVDLSGFENRYPDKLSGGEAQRVALARALAPEPEVLLLDEPFASLDAELRVRVRTEVAELLRSLNVTSVFVTHDQEEAFIVGDEVAVMKSGTVIQTGPPTEIYQRPQTPWIARFVGDANILPAAGDGPLLHTPVGTLPRSVDASGTDGDATIMVRPEHLDVVAGARGVVESVEFYGHDSAYVVRLPEASVSVRSLSVPRFKVGDEVDVVYGGEQVHVFEAQAAPGAGTSQ